MKKKSLYIYGASGHGLVVADIARENGYSEILFIDDGENEYPTFNEISHDDTIPFALAIGDNKIRVSIFKKIKEKKLNIIALIHPSAVISQNVQVGEGTVIMANVVINTKSHIGKGCILNTSVVIEHENILGDFVHISPGSILAGGVKVSDFTHIGMGTSIKQGVHIGKNTIIGMGSVILNNIKDNCVAYGNPCKEKRVR